ncbi:bromodomain testis-specific protein [Drosophila pseudoobscura]|uniref:Bromodomain testis-specific protein n=1 Tax=Drosophila pseudoobscura pseudoobscura TaxID=46245 RepID=A0A6I8UTI5_DROPS|nr:bromodomain testis-specific protein [Drosophila pseudoobscura]
MSDRNRNCNRNRNRNPEPFPESNACKAIIRKLFSSQYKKLAWIFYEPIDAPYLGLHDYHKIVKKPMDLNSIRTRLQAGLYVNADEFVRDVRLMFDNTYLYTTPDHLCHQMAKKLQAIFEAMFFEIASTDSSDTITETDVSSMFPIATIPDAPINPHKDGGVKMTRARRQQLQSRSANEAAVRPWTAKENNHLGDRLQELKGEVLHRVIHIIKEMENIPIINGGMEFNLESLKTQTKCSIVRYLASKDHSSGRRTRSKIYLSTSCE